MVQKSDHQLRGKVVYISGQRNPDDFSLTWEICKHGWSDASDFNFYSPYEALFAIQFLDAHISKQIDQRLKTHDCGDRFDAYLHNAKKCSQTKALSEKMTVANTAMKSFLHDLFKSRSLITIECFY